MLDDDVRVQVWDSNSEIRYLVLPERPAGTESMSEDELAALVTRARATKRPSIIILVSATEYGFNLGRLVT
jgi:hypothetical protein